MLANVLGINLGELQLVLGERRVGFSNLRACGMLTRRGGVYYLHIVGARRIYPAPLPNGIFSIEEGSLLYYVQVEQYQPEEEIPEEDEDQEEEQPQTRFATYQDFQGFGGTVKRMHNLSLNLRESTSNLSTQFVN